MAVSKAGDLNSLSILYPFRIRFNLIMRDRHAVPGGGEGGTKALKREAGAGSGRCAACFKVLSA